MASAGIDRDGASARSALAWLLPSWFAACAAVGVAGLVEGLTTTDRLRDAAAAAGFAAILALPLGLVLILLVRALWAAWRPRALAAELIEADGGAPRLAAWLLFLALAAAGLGGASWLGVRRLFVLTSGTPTVIGLGAALIALLAGTALTLVGRPLLVVFTAAARRIGRRLRWCGRPATTPVRLLVLAALLAVGGVIATWTLVIRPRVGHVDLSIAVHPLVFVATAALAHAAWPRLHRHALARRLAVGLATTAAVAAVGFALAVRARDPALLLSIWGEYSVAGTAIDTLYDLDDVRDDLHLQVFRPVERPGVRHPDIVLVTIDTMRADRGSPYGGPAKMPTLAALAEQGVLFERAFSPSNVTRRSVPSMALGLTPTRIRGKPIGWALRLDPRHVTLAERLRVAGYDTAGFFCCSSFWEPSRHLGLDRGLDHLEFERDGAKLAEQARDWLEARAAQHPDRPVFVWIHFLEPHSWKGKRAFPTAVEQRFRLYDTTLRTVDGFLDTVVSAFADRPADERPLIAVTSDHGEGLGEHGAPHHASDVYDSQIHVPFVIAGPGVARRRIRETVSVTSLAATLIDLAGFEPPGMPDMDGVSLAPLVTGARHDDPDGGEAHAIMMADRSVERTRRALIRGGWKLITDADASAEGAELYDLRRDPGELHDRARTEPVMVETLRAAMIEHLHAVDRVPAFR